MKSAMAFAGVLPLVVAALLAGCGGGGGGGTATPTGGNGGDGGGQQTVTKTVSGTVLDESGNTVAGATVSLASTRATTLRQSTITDADGRYTLSVTVTTSTREIVLNIASDSGSTQVSADVSQGDAVETVAVIVEGAGAPQTGNAPPTVTGASVSPSSLEVTGEVLLSVSATDPEGDPVRVVAVITEPDKVSCVALSAGEGVYSGVFEVPANYGQGAEKVTYAVYFCATDAPGSCQSVTSGEVTFDVHPMTAPPNMPGDAGA